MKISNESKVGILAAIAILLLIFGYNFLKGKDLLTRKNTYYAYFENVDRLGNANPVMLNGYKVGMVTGVELLKKDKANLLVAIDVARQVKLPNNTVLKIISADLFGSKAIELALGDSKEMASHNDTLIGKLEPGFVENMNKITAPLKEKVESILESLDSTLGGESGENIRGSIASFQSSLKSLEIASNKLSNVMDTRIISILDNVNSIASNLEKNNDNISAITSNMRTFSDTLTGLRLLETAEKANALMKTLQETFDNVNKGKGTLGQLAQNESLYNELNSTARDLDLLLKDLKKNPKSYVHFSMFGRKDKREK